MGTKIKRLFVIKNRFEAYLIIYALAMGAVERGQHYRIQYPGLAGKLLFVAACSTVIIAGAKILDAVRLEQAGQLAVVT
jgi:hypothetical protein